MRAVFVSLLFIVALNTSAQNQYPKIKYIDTYDGIFKGVIDYTDYFTIYLRFHAYSNQSLGSYSVKGWYKKDKENEKTAIAGLYDGDLTIYAFRDSSSYQHLLNFETEKNNFYEEMAFYKNLPSYTHKFYFGDYTTLFTNGKDSLNVMLGEYTLDIKKSHEYLMFNPSKGFKLDLLGDKNWAFDILAEKDNRYILEYSHASKPHFMGMCGAGEESGLLYLEFDTMNKLEDYHFYQLESCLFSTSSAKEILPNGTTKYTIESYEDEDTSVIIVNTMEVTIASQQN